MIRIFLALMFVTLGACHAISARAVPTQCRGTERMLEKASRIRGLAIIRPVPCLVSDRAGIEDYLRETIRTQLPPSRMVHEELAYKDLGLLPPDFDYSEGIISLYLSQIGAYYDPIREHYVMASWLSPETQEEITIHELTHALQDQHYDLERLIDHSIENGDRLLARSALAEGDATFVERDYMRRKTGAISDEEHEARAASYEAAQISKASPDGPPKSLRQILIFPYLSGARFVNALAKRGGLRELMKAYKRPPDTTEEILHPEKYLSERADYIEFSERDLRIAPIGPEYEAVYQDTLGEFGIAALLGMYPAAGVSPDQAARGWGGDKLILFTARGGERRCIVWKSNWDSEKDAREFYDYYRRVLAAKYPESLMPVVASRGSGGGAVTASISLDEARVTALVCSPHS